MMTSLVQDRHSPRPTSRSLVYLYWKAYNLKSARGQDFEIVQLLKMRIADFATRSMPFPNQFGSPTLFKLTLGMRQRGIPTPSGCADQANALLQQPHSRGLSHAAT